MDANKNKTLVIVLVAVLVVLIGIAGFLFSQRQADSLAAQTGDAQTTDAGANMSSNVEAVEFDVATATQVPSGEAPAEYLERYLAAIDKSDWETAYSLLPLDRKNYYGSAEAFGQQLASYKIIGHKDVTTVSEGTDADGNKELVLKGSMETDGNGTWSYDWTFVQVDGTWFAKTRGSVIME